MNNNAAIDAPTIDTLICDGYLMELAEGYSYDEKEVARAKMEWMDDYYAFMLDEINAE